MYQFLFGQIRFLRLSPNFTAQPGGRGDTSGKIQVVSSALSTENGS